MQKGTHKELIAKEGTCQDFIKIRERAEGWKLMGSKIPRVINGNGIAKTIKNNKFLGQLS